MKKILLIICLLFMSVISVQAATPEVVSGDKAEAVVAATADEALNFLKSYETGNTAELEAKFADILDEYFNVDYIAKASLGKYWKKTSDNQKKEYIKIFKDKIVKVYSVRFEEYTDQIIEIKKSAVRGRGDVIVFSVIKSGDGSQPPLDVDWRVRVGKDGSYKIIDLSIAGVSMLITQKNEYETIIEQNGGSIDALIRELSNMAVGS